MDGENGAREGEAPADRAGGDGLTYTVTYLEMDGPPAGPPKPRPVGAPLALMRCERPPLHFFLYLYETVGADYDWTDLLRWPRDELAAFVSDPLVELWVLYRHGAPAGFHQLDFREDRVCELAYFGLMPEAVGQGVGPWLLDTALREAWGRGVATMRVNTCTLDHPAALRTYQRAGFAPVRREVKRRPAADAPSPS